MKQAFIFFLILMFFHLPIFAETTPDDSKTEEALKANVVDFRDWLIKELSQFPKNPPRKYGASFKKVHLNPEKKPGYQLQPIQPSRKVRLGERASITGTYHLESATCLHCRNSIRASGR
jgi:hypothetical protein